MLDRIALCILIIGGINWGSIGLFAFDLVAFICGGQTGGVWVWLSPALRALDLWLFWAAALLLLRLADCTSRRVPYIAAVPLAVYTVTHFIPALATVAAVAFVAFSVLMLWFAAVMIKSYNAARVKK